MKFYLITDDSDALTGMHLAGIGGELVSDASSAEAALRRTINDGDIGILLVTDSIAAMCPETVKTIQLTCNQPLLVQIPNSDGSERSNHNIMKIVNEAIGM